ncbi:MAG: DUF1800 domain-containing protein [Leadbetterella sp.]
MNPISRRELFGVFGAGNTSRLAVSSFDEYIQPLSRQQVMHLLRRTTYGMSIDIIDKYVGKRASEIVDDLFRNADNKINPAPPPFVNDTIRNPSSLSGKDKETEDFKRGKHTGDYLKDLQEWWAKLLKVENNSILEKMVFFWHDHFATQYANCENIPVMAMYNQNTLFRKNYAGSFRFLLEQISVDSAMLIYLNGNLNIAEAPNENYARELMELFSIGVGNYTEQDVREAAKILTGWRTTMFSNEGQVANKGYIVPALFERNAKMFMGESFNVNYEVTTDNVFQNSVKKLIGVLFTKRSKEMANFMSNKLYQYFVYSNPAKVDQNIVNAMASKFIASNFEFKPMLKSLLVSKHFFDSSFIGSQLKSPLETIMSMHKHMSYKDAWARNIMTELDLELLNPPNVAGWKGYRNWVSTKSLPSTITFLREIINSTTNVQIAEWGQSFNGYDNPDKFVTYMMELFLVETTSADRLKKFKSILLKGSPDFEWYEIVKNKETMGARIRGLLFDIIKTPDYFLY